MDLNFLLVVAIIALPPLLRASLASGRTVRRWHQEQRPFLHMLRRINQCRDLAEVAGQRNAWARFVRWCHEPSSIWVFLGMFVAAFIGLMGSLGTMSAIMITAGEVAVIYLYGLSSSKRRLRNLIGPHD